MERQREGVGEGGGSRTVRNTRHAAEDLHEASPGEGCFRLRVCTFSQQLVYLFNPPGRPLPSSVSPFPSILAARMDRKRERLG